MVFIYINLHDGHVDLGNFGIYVGETRQTPHTLRSLSNNSCASTNFKSISAKTAWNDQWFQRFQWKAREKTTKYPNKWVKLRRKFLVAFHGFFTAFSRVFHGRFTDFSRSRFCGKFQVGTFTRSYSVLYLVTSWSKMQTFVQSPCSQAHFTCIELNQIAFLSTYLLTMISQHDMWASWTKYV